MAGTIIVDKIRLDVGQDTLNILSNTGSTILSANTSGINAAFLGFGTLPSGRLPTGAVLQVVSNTKTNTFSTTSTSYVDVTGLSVSITPTSSTSKILITYTINVGFDLYRGIAVQLVRNSTAICIGDAADSRNRASNFTGQDPEGTYVTRSIICLNNNFLDSPSTTSATTYKLQMGAISEADPSTIYVNRSGADGDNQTVSRVASTITVMEIAA